MNQLKTIVNTVLKMSLGRMIDGETREWPPMCVGFAYQPRRPKSTCRSDKISDASNPKQNVQ